MKKKFVLGAFILVIALLFLSLYFTGTRTASKRDSVESTKTDNQTVGQGDTFKKLNEVEPLLKDFLEQYETEAVLMKKQLDDKGKVFAAYDILGQQSEPGGYAIYLWTMQQGIALKDGQLELLSGASGPLILHIGSKDNTFEVLSEFRPSDGAGYKDDIEKYFPNELADQIFGYPSDTDAILQLGNEIQNQAKNFFQLHSGTLFTVSSSSPKIPIEQLKNKSLSPFEKKTAWLYPGEWETISDIFIASDLEQSSETAWTKLALNQSARAEMWKGTRDIPWQKYTPKGKVLWEDKEHLLVIIGFAYGTVSPGGDVVRVNINTGESEMVYPAHENGVQVTDMKLEDGQLTMTAVNNNEPSFVDKKEIIYKLN